MWFNDECNSYVRGVYQHSTIHLSKEKKKEYNGEVLRKKHLITTALFEELKS